MEDGYFFSLFFLILILLLILILIPILIPLENVKPLTILKRGDSRLTRCAVNFFADSGWTPLMHACSRGNAALARALVEAGADVNAQNNQCWSPLTVATMGGFIDIAEFLLDQSTLDLKARSVIMGYFS